MPWGSKVAMAFAQAVYRWADHREAARMVVVSVLLILARLLQDMRRISGVSRMTVPVKSLVSELAPAAQEPATSNDRVGNELPAEPKLSIMHKCVEFCVGQYVTYPGSQVGQITAIDEDGDLIVSTDHGRKAIWFVHECKKSLSVGDRVAYPCGEVGQVVDFDEEGDLHVIKTDGTKARWFAAKSTRMLSVGDSVEYPGGEVATVLGFDADGDVNVVTAAGRRATWFAAKCM